MPCAFAEKRRKIFLPLLFFFPVSPFFAEYIPQPMAGFLQRVVLTRSKNMRVKSFFLCWFMALLLLSCGGKNRHTDIQERNDSIKQDMKNANEGVKEGFEKTKDEIDSLKDSIR